MTLGKVLCAIRAYIRSMCGRFTNRLTWREIVALYRLSVPATPERNLAAATTSALPTR
jgi:hypothetical protein